MKPMLLIMLFMYTASSQTEIKSGQLLKLKPTQEVFKLSPDEPIKVFVMRPNGCFNCINTKYHEDIDNGYQILIQSRGSNSLSRRSLISTFSRLGISKERVIIHEIHSEEEYLKEYSKGELSFSTDSLVLFEYVGL